MPEGTWVFPDKQGNPGICMFRHDIQVQGYLIRGSWMGKEGFMSAFNASGKLHWFYSRDPVAVDGVLCKDSLFDAIYLHENGWLQQCALDKAATIGGVKYSRVPPSALIKRARCLKIRGATIRINIKKQRSWNGVRPFIVNKEVCLR